MASKRILPAAVRFCRALHSETSGSLRYATIAKQAKRMGLGLDETIVLAADCAAAGWCSST